MYIEKVQEKFAVLRLLSVNLLYLAMAKNTWDEYKYTHLCQLNKKSEN